MGEQIFILSEKEDFIDELCSLNSDVESATGKFVLIASDPQVKIGVTLIDLLKRI